MGQQKSSAQPQNLLTYYTETQKINDFLQSHHPSITQALQYFQATCTEFPLPRDLTALPEKLTRLINYAQQGDM